MSDSNYSIILENKFDYKNTFYHCDPYLDIYNEEHINNYKDLDFIISSDVFEHINPYPGLQIAFNNMYKMLKTGGFIIFSVPYNEEEHIEHYPNLFEYTINKSDNDNDNDNYILFNKTIYGKTEVFDNLCFHEDPGSTLEMRIFSKKSITQYLLNSGFSDIIFHSINSDMKKYGIFWSKSCSYIITATK